MMGDYQFYPLTGSPLYDAEDRVIFSTAGPVWALSWCPQSPKGPLFQNQFLAVGCHPSDLPQVQIGQPVSGHSKIQIWRVGLPEQSTAGPKDESTATMAKSVSNAKGKKSMSPVSKMMPVRKSEFVAADEGAEETDVEITDNLVDKIVPESMVGQKSCHASLVAQIPHEGGFTRNLKWRPVSGQLDPWNQSSVEPSGNLSSLSGSLGHLAAVLGDGSVIVYNVPYSSELENVEHPLNTEAQKSPAVSNFHLAPIFHWKCNSKRRSLAMVVEWSTQTPWDKISVGFHDGTVGVWKVEFDGQSRKDVVPVTRFAADSQPIRALAWAPPGSGALAANLIVTGGHRGTLRFWDLRDPFRPLWETLTTRGWILAVDWLPIPSCVVLSMDDGSLRFFSMAEVLSELPFSNSPAHSFKGVHSLLCRRAAVWDIALSRATGQAAYCSADGTVHHFQLTHKWAAQKFQARNRQPHFLLGGFRSVKTMEPSSLYYDSTAVTLQEGGSRSKGAGMEEGDLKRRQGEVVAARSRKSSGGRLGSAIDSEDDGLGREESRGEGGSAGSNVGADLHAYGSRGEVGSEEAAATRDLMTSRELALHRVVWNPNAGCERWLAYAGASGLVCCQIVKALKVQKV